VVSGGAEDSIEQMAYQVGQQVACAGGTEEEAALTEELWPLIANAQTYEEYRQAVETLLEMPGLRAATGLELNSEEGWSPWPVDIDARFDPMEVISHTTIPILAFFGELDKNIDPVQGAQAYEEALDSAGNTDSEVVVIEGAGHVLTSAETGCLGEQSGPAYVPEYLEILETWLQDL
jgi:pimeloyl-ACP methyl ester carboxylesterase